MGRVSLDISYSNSMGGTGWARAGDGERKDSGNIEREKGPRPHPEESMAEAVEWRTELPPDQGLASSASSMYWSTLLAASCRDFFDR